MKKLQVLVVGMLLVGGWVTSASAVDFVQADGSICKDRPFSGMVTKAVLEIGPSDAIEVIDRGAEFKKPAARFKAKRIRVEEDGVAYPLMDSVDKKCVATTASAMFGQQEVEVGLLMPGEKLRALSVTDEGKTKVGEHKTVQVWIVE